jgi:hypothetical protein
MEQDEHLRALSAARKRLVDERHQMACLLETQIKIAVKDKDGLTAQFVRVQEAVDAIDRAIEGEQKRMHRSASRQKKK